jgi:anti-sigma B factor antagonist
VTLPPEQPRVAEVPVPGALKIESLRDRDTLIVALSGELDLASAPDLERELQVGAEGAPSRMVIDLSGLGFMDSTGLQALLRARERAQEAGYLLSLRRGPHQVQRVFELTKTVDAFTFVD